MKKRILAAIALVAFVVVLVMTVVVIGSNLFQKVEGAATPAATDVPAIPDETDEDAALVSGDEEAPLYTLVGAISGITQESFLIEDAAFGQVQVNISDDTVFGGLPFAELTEGMTVSILFNGQMSRSIPAQVSALGVEAHVFTGTVAELREDGEVLIRLDTADEDVRMTLPEGAETPAVGARITCYTNGVQTMSLPPLMNALAVVIEK